MRDGTRGVQAESASSSSWQMSVDETRASERIYTIRDPMCTDLRRRIGTRLFRLFAVSFGFGVNWAYDADCLGGKALREKLLRSWCTNRPLENIDVIRWRHDLKDNQL